MRKCWANGIVSYQCINLPTAKKMLSNIIENLLCGCSRLWGYHKLVVKYWWKIKQGHGTGLPVHGWVTTYKSEQEEQPLQGMGQGLSMKMLINIHLSKAFICCVSSWCDYSLERAWRRITFMEWHLGSQEAQNSARVTTLVQTLGCFYLGSFLWIYF